MNTIQTYVRKGQHVVRRLSLNPRAHILVRTVLHTLAGFLLSAASLSNGVMPLTLGMVLSCTGWPALLTAAGGCLGYWVFWGTAGYQGMVWLAAALPVTILITDRRISRDAPLLLPAAGALIVAATGVLFQTLEADNGALAIFLLRICLASGSAWLFARVMEGRNPILDWLACGLAVLALAQIMPVPYLGLGFLVAGILAVTGAFPAMAIAGLALDLAQITPVPMTAVMTISYFARLLPWQAKPLARFAPGFLYLTVAGLCGCWDLLPLPGLLLGGILGGFVPARGKVAHRRGETGAAQVRLEMVSGVLAQTELLLLEAPQIPVDEEALVAKAAERACSGCPCRKTCTDSKRIAQLPATVLHKPLLTPEELPIICRKSGRFLAELHRSQEQLCSIRADRERQQEYRAAVVQQYQFLSEYLQQTANQLASRAERNEPNYKPVIRIYGNRPPADNGDRCISFPGTACRYYVLLCDGMGTGLGAVQEGRTAATLLRRLLGAGFPAEYALRSLNSLCALRDRAGAVTVDLAELYLDTGRAVIYKWGAAPSYLVGKLGAQKIGAASPPPGLSVTDSRETGYRVSMRGDQSLVLVSDGIGEEEAFRCCLAGKDLPVGELAARLIGSACAGGEDDATVATIRLEPLPPQENP